MEWQTRHHQPLVASGVLAGALRMRMGTCLLGFVRSNLKPSISWWWQAFIVRRLGAARVLKCMQVCRFTAPMVDRIFLSLCDSFRAPIIVLLSRRLEGSSSPQLPRRCAAALTGPDQGRDIQIQSITVELIAVNHILNSMGFDALVDFMSPQNPYPADSFLEAPGALQSTHKSIDRPDRPLPRSQIESSSLVAHSSI